MSEVGLFLSSEEHGPRDLVDQAQIGEEAGFSSVFISDHFHPWVESQGQSPFVWSVIGGIATTTRHKITTGVTCPTFRLHPAIIAQAAATSQVMAEGRFVLGVGSGEALNEHILGQRWPAVSTRLEMLEEAIEIIRRLWSGKMVTHHGRFYTVENARLYSVPDSPPPVAVSAFGPDSLGLAARIGDGLVTTQPDGDMVRSYREQGGAGRVIGAVKVCWGDDEAQARKVAHELWATELLPGQLNQELSVPKHFQEGASLVTQDMVAEKVTCGPDPERHAAAISAYLDAGFDEVYVNQIGQDQRGFCDFYRTELRPRIGS
ncbi:MAG TPA: TIGR03557 family F420-dependent LLM class oxidoreductase [Acidimicrobiales bacterium]|nr:TIGR03557 family F420-dependent LLM class oxidoreductase [Acidimicrobiales bacterium]